MEVSQMKNYSFEAIPQKSKSPQENKTSILIQDDCHLPAYIKPKKNQLQVKTSEIQKVLLTGVTGVLGPYLLLELLKVPQINKVICLLRPSKGKEDVEALETRLRQILEERGILMDIDMDKVSVVRGDVAEKYFNFDKLTWQELINSVDAVIHCAAKISYLEEYTSSGSGAEVRSVNLSATKNVLEFACAGNKLKHVFYSSSIIATGQVDEEEWRISEEWPTVGDFDGNNTTLAYPISKFVGEMLMKQAVKERGVPGKVFRFPLIGGDSKKGKFPNQSNIIFSGYLFALRHGILLDNSFFSPFLPVDKCAEAAVKLFFIEDAPHDVYNIIHGSINERDFGRLASKLGYEMTKPKDMSEIMKWICLLSDSDNSMTAKILASMFSALITKENGPQHNIFTIIQKWDPERMPNFFESKKLKTFLPEFLETLESGMDYLEKDILYAKSEGWF